MIPSNISWTGGLWRIWIVLSCLWVVLAYFITDPIGKIQHRNDPILIYIDEITAEFPSNIDPKVMTKALVELVKKEMPTRNPETEAAKALQRYSPPDSVWAILYGTAMWATLPPLAILAIAYVIGWIGRGFVP